MAFDPSLFDSGGGVPGGLFGGDTADPEEEEIVRRTRNDIATKAGYPTWEAYQTAVGTNVALDQQKLGLQIQQLQDQIARGGQVSPTTAAQLAQSSQQFNLRLQQDRADLVARTQQQQAALAEQQRQFNETLGSDKAKFNTQQQFGQQQLAQQAQEAQAQRDFTGQQNQLNREQQTQQTLLGLGSRPDTLIRYLYALRGQQAPQGLGAPPALGGTPAASPAPSVTPSVAGASPSAPPAATPPIVPSPVIQSPGLTPQQTGITPSGPGARAPVIGNVTGQVELPSTGADINRLAGVGVHSFAGVPTSQAQNPNPGQPFFLSNGPEARAAGQAAQAAAIAGPGLRGAVGSGQYNSDLTAMQQRALPADERARARFAEGGVIPEPVMGMGMMSGQPYMLGEESMKPGHREVVVPEKKVPKDIFDRLMEHAGEVHYSEDGSGKRSIKVKGMANGGLLGYDPTVTGKSVFNPSSISNTFSFPQIPALTGGTSLIPSAQRLFQALPSERQLYAGYLQDEAGVQPQDVFDIAKRLAPQASGLRTPRFAN